MGAFGGPDIITDGLLFAIDAGSERSYPGTGTTTTSLVGAAQTGTLINGVGFDSANGGTWEFDGTDDYLNTTSQAYPVDGTDPFTIEVWIMIPTGATWYNSGNGTSIIGRGSYAGSIGILRRGTDSIAVWLRLNGGSIYDPAVSGLQRDVFHQIVGTFNGVDTMKCYHNGAYNSQEISSNNAGTVDGGGFRLGGNIAFGGTNGGYGEGSIPLARLYNRALTAAEISQNYNAQKNRFI
jgi:hypothetical protein